MRLADVVQEYGGDDRREAEQGGGARGGRRGDAADGEGEHDRDRRRVRLEDVVGVLDHSRHEQTAERLEHDHRPDERAEADERA